jgi:uncharacterized membrane protein (DUF2068 family)
VGISEFASSDRVLKLIALFRLSKALLLILAGFGALQLLRPEVAARAVEWVRAYPFAMRALRSPEHIEIIAGGAFCYAALFMTEGVGLWLEKRWAEYLTVVATISFIPFEVWEIVKRVTVLRVAIVIANIAIVIYLLWRLSRRKHRFGRISG